MTGGGFLDRWSRRKRATEADSAAEQQAETTPEARAQAGEAPEASAEPPAEPPAAPPAEPLTEEEWRALLPPIEQITAETDIRAFMQKGVPAALRNAALRRAWAADPLIASYEDPARDYFWDWNAPGGVPGGGGSLDPGRVARMLRDIVGPEEKPQADSSAESARPPPEGGAGVAESAAAEAEHAPAASPAPPPAGPDPAAPAPQASDNAPRNADASAPMRRRHGGAVPG